MEAQPASQNQRPDFSRVNVVGTSGSGKSTFSTALAKKLYQAVRRAFIRSLHRKELWPNTGNKESLRKSFMSKDSIILWMLKTYSKVQSRYEQRMCDDQYKNIHFFRLKSPREAKRFIDSLSIPKMNEKAVK